MKIKERTGITAMAAVLLVALLGGALVFATLASAQEDGIQRGIDADAARYAALGNYYLDGIQRGIDADAARYAALGKFYGQGTVELPYTDVSKFYAERMRVQAHQASEVAELPYTDVSKFYAERMRVPAYQESSLAANPELVFARRFYRAADSMLALNPELMVARSYSEAAALAASAARLAANPELSSLDRYETCGC